MQWILLVEANLIISCDDAIRIRGFCHSGDRQFAELEIFATTREGLPDRLRPRWTIFAERMITTLLF